MNKDPRRIVRAVLCLVAAAAALIVTRWFLQQEMTGEVLPAVVEQISLLGWAALILASAMSGGMAVLRLLGLKPQRAGAAALFGAGVGLGILSIVTLGLGVAGICNTVTGVIVLLALVALGLRDLTEIGRAARAALKKARHASAFRIALWLVLGIFLVMNLTRAFQPPWDYDSLEYHVGAPAAYHSRSRVYFMRDNVYANFPQNVEMLHFLAMRLTNSPDRGALVGQLLGAACGFLAALALREMVRGLAGKTTGDIAAAFFYTWPGVTLYSGMAYVELPLMFYGTLAVWGLLWSWRRKRTAPGAQGWVILAGIAAGLAMGVKYTAAPLVFMPIVGWLVALGLAGRIKFAQVAPRAARFVGVAVLVFSPWLIRNAHNTGNPVYPLLYGVFGSSNWDAEKDARWTEEHSPKDLSVRNLVRQAKDVLFFDEKNASLLLLVFVPFALIAGKRTRGVVLMLAAHAVLLFLLWFLFTQQNSRFLEIGIPILAALSALGLGALFQFTRAVGLRPVIIFLLLFGPSRWHGYGKVAESLRFITYGREKPDYYLNLHDPPFYAAMKFINESKTLPADARILFVGEAQTFYCRRDVVAATVFDTNLLERIVNDSNTTADIYEKLRKEPITHIYIDMKELARLQRTYEYVFEGEKRPGMMAGFNWKLFGEFVEKYLNRIPWQKWDGFRPTDKDAQPAERKPIDCPHIEIYELKAPER